MRKAGLYRVLPIFRYGASVLDGFQAASTCLFNLFEHPSRRLFIARLIG
jgi:hypothetical protein